MDEIMKFVIIYCVVILINSIVFVDCTECEWETRFHPKKPVALYYPRSEVGIDGEAFALEFHERNRRILQQEDKEQRAETDRENSTDKTLINTTDFARNNSDNDSNSCIDNTTTPADSLHTGILSEQDVEFINPSRDDSLDIKNNALGGKHNLPLISSHENTPTENAIPKDTSDNTNCKEYGTSNGTLCRRKRDDVHANNQGNSTNTLTRIDNAPNNTYPSENYTNVSRQMTSNLPASQKTDVNDAITLHIVGLFAMSGEYPAGLAYLPAALIAIRHINNDPTILPGYRLQLNIHDTRCLPEWGLDGLYTELYNESRVSVMTLGTTCSHVCESTAKVSNIWGMVQISYSAVSPHLSNKTIFPSFFRVTTPEQILNTGRIKMFKAMNWSRVHTIYQNYKLFSTLNEQMIKEFRGENITVVSSNMFTTDPLQSVEKLQKVGARIIIGSFYEDMARKVMCAAHNLRDGYSWYQNVVWFLPSFLDRGWTGIPHGEHCSVEDIAKVAGKYFTIGSFTYNDNTSYKAVGNVSKELFEDFNLYNETKDEIPAKFQHLYSHCHQSVKNCSLFAIHRSPEAFDAVWAIALALDNTLNYLKATGDPRRLEDFDYGENDGDLSCIIQQATKNVSFNALSGTFRFNSNGDGMANIGISRFNNSGGNNLTLIGRCKSSEDGKSTCEIDGTRIRWDTQDGKPPYDGMQRRFRAIEIGVGVKIVFFSFACLGILISLCLLVFNVWNRNHRIIKMSSPRLNNMILVGSALGYVDIVVQDDGDLLNLNICKIRLFTKPLSFCLMFGSLFAKTWRVYQIFTAGAQAYKLNKKILRDSSLFLIVVSLVSITCGILGTWMVISPQKAVTANISVTGVHDNSKMNVDVVYVNQFHHCDSVMEQEFTIGLSAFYGLVIMFGAFLAVQTRKVSYPEFNDSKLIAMAIYNVVVLEPVGMIMTWAIKDKPELRWALYSLMQITMSSVTLGLLFVPKIISYRRHNRKSSESGDEQSANSDFKRSSNRVREIFANQSSDRMSCQPPHDIPQRPIGINMITSPALSATLSSLNQNLRRNQTQTQKIPENIRDETFEIYKLENRNKSYEIPRDFSETDSKMNMESMKMKMSPLVVLSENEQTRSVIFKRSLSDPNLASVLQNTSTVGNDDVFKQKDYFGNEYPRTDQKPPASRRYSNFHRDDKFVQEVKFKADVKVKSWSGIFGMSKGLTASWKQKSYTQKTDTGSNVNLILE